MAQTNAEQKLREMKRTEEEKSGALQRLQDQLMLTKLPRRIECYDISLFQGGSAVGSGVSFWDGEPDKANYRRYKVKDVKGTDDFAMMYEVLCRRLKRGVAEKNLPDLLVIDGGKGQLGSAVAALKDLGVTGVDVCSLAKSRIVDEDELAQGRGYSGATRAREHAKAQGPSEQTRSPERVFLPNVKDPIVLRQNSPELLILTRARDEAHRFAITFHRQLRSKKSIQSAMDSITGVGPEKKKLLLRHFGSVTQVKGATVEQLAAVEGVGVTAARRVFSQLHPAPATAPSVAPPNKP